MAGRAIIASSYLVLAIASLLALSGCAKSSQPIVEPPVAPQNSESITPPPPPQPPKEIQELPPLKPEEVQAAVKRIFKDSVVIDASRQPSFLVGDFNGDKSQDLAVVLKPADGKLSELNREFPVWLAREPLEEVLPKSKLLVPAKSRPNPAAGQTVRFEQSDILMAIIHGEGALGWRDPQARQTHLLRGVVGTDVRTMTFKQAVEVYKRTKPFPTIYGDLIQEKLVGESGFLYFKGGVYGWYDPKNFKSETGGSPHSGMSRMK